jgi:hypothetical protein
MNSLHFCFKMIKDIQRRKQLMVAFCRICEVKEKPQLCHYPSRSYNFWRTCGLSGCPLLQVWGSEWKTEHLRRKSWARWRTNLRSSTLILSIRRYFQRGLHDWVTHLRSKLGAISTCFWQLNDISSFLYTLKSTFNGTNDMIKPKLEHLKTRL